MTEYNPFEVDWQECLRAHYAHVVREEDHNNEKSLITVLYDTGFSEQDVHDMRAAIVGYSEDEIQETGEGFDIAQDDFDSSDAELMDDEPQPTTMVDDLPEIEAVAEMEPAAEPVDLGEMVDEETELESVVDLAPEVNSEISADDLTEASIEVIADQSEGQIDPISAVSASDAESAPPAKPSKAAKSAKSVKDEPPSEVDNPTQMSLF